MTVLERISEKKIRQQILLFVCLWVCYHDNSTLRTFPLQLVLCTCTFDTCTNKDQSINQSDDMQCGYMPGNSTTDSVFL